jgi:hypothetical protein
MDPATWLCMMAVGYVLTVAVETPVLLAGLSPRHPIRHRLFAGFWLTACTYPIVWLVLPPLLPDRGVYLAVAETFAPVAECVLFWLAFGRTEPRTTRATVRDLAAVALANLLSFGVGEVFSRTIGWAWLTGQ